MSRILEKILDKITFANFVRYFGPGIVLFGIIRLSTTQFCSELCTKLPCDKQLVAVGALFLTMGTLLYHLYRAFFYDRIIGELKDLGGRMREWKNYRQIIKQEYQSLQNKAKEGNTISSYNAEWIWRQIKWEKRFDEYGPMVELWAASIHLLYFTGLSMMLFSIAEFALKEGKLVWFYLLGGAIVFWGGYLSDNEYERAETYRYCPPGEDLKETLRKIQGNSAFCAKGLNGKEK